LVRYLIPILGVLLLYQFTRLIFFSYNYSFFKNEVSVFRLLTLQWHAIRFDISAIITLSLPYLFFAFLPLNSVHRNSHFRKWLLWLFLLPQLIAILFDLADIAYYPYVRKRMGADVFDLLGRKSDFIDLLPSYVRNFWFVFLLGILFIIVSIKVVKRWIPEKTKPLSSAFKSWSLFLLVMACSILFIRGGFQLKPLLTANARQVASNLEVPLVVNTPFNIIHSLEQPTLKAYHDYSDQEAWKQCSPVKHFTGTAPFTSKNVVLIILESFGKGFTGMGGRSSYTPFLDSLAGESLQCTRAFANAHRSSDGIPACVAGIPNCMDESFMNSPYATNEIESIAQVLKRKQYHTSFFHGGTNGTMSFDLFARAAGFDRYYGRTEYANDHDYDGTWGIWDEPFLQYVCRSLDQQKAPFFSTVFTLSSHEPFHLPEGYSNSEIARLKGIYRGVRYTDEALRKFFETASHSSWYRNTLFVITADHNFLAYYDSLGYYNQGLGLYALPMLYFAPGDPQLKGVSSLHTQQIDILPSVLQYLRYPDPFFAFGNSIFDSSANRYVYTYTDGHSQFLSGSYLLVDDDDVLSHIFNFSNDSLLHTPTDQEEVRRIIELRWKAFRQVLHGAILQNRQSIKTWQGH